MKIRPAQVIKTSLLWRYIIIFLLWIIIKLDRACTGRQVLEMLLSCKAPSFEKRWMRLLSFRFSQHFVKLKNGKLIVIKAKFCQIIYHKEFLITKRMFFLSLLWLMFCTAEWLKKLYPSRTTTVIYLFI